MHDHDDHQHDHGRQHGHDHDETHGAAFFDEAAATWDDPAKVERAATVAAAIRATVPVGPTTRVLEYGAGTGLVTQALGDVGPVALADASEGMRAAMQAKVDAGTLPADARIWALDLATDPVPDEPFDLIVTVMVLHHIVDVDRVLAGFAALLAPGGHLCIVDLDHEDGSFHGDGFAGHHGFHRPTLAAQLTAAGFTEPAFSDCAQMVRDGVPYDLFLAVAGAPAGVDAAGSG